jgi:hypothetical protein
VPFKFRYLFVSHGLFAQVGSPRLIESTNSNPPQLSLARIFGVRPIESKFEAKATSVIYVITSVFTLSDNQRLRPGLSLIYVVYIVPSKAPDIQENELTRFLFGPTLASTQYLAYISQHVVGGAIHEFGELLELRSQLVGDHAPLCDRRVTGALHENGIDRSEHHLAFTLVEGRNVFRSSPLGIRAHA